MSRAHRVWMTVACLLVLIFCLGAVGRCQDEEVIKRKSDEEDNSRRGSLMSAPKLDARSQHPETITEQLEQQSLAFSAKNQPMVSRKNNAPQNQAGPRRRLRRAPVAPPVSLALLSAIASGSKSEPPSRPTNDWSKQRPYFGPDMTRNVSVELGKTAYLTCKVYELGDKTVSWLRPSENVILTAGRYTYIGDPRFASINDNGSHDWILEIKDVGLNDSTSYECQVSTDPKMSTIINLHVKAAKAQIKQGEQVTTSVGSQVEFACGVGQKINHLNQHQQQSSVGVQQTYWYFNGNLLNYARSHHNSPIESKNFSIDWDPVTQSSKFKLFNVQTSDAGNYTCKPTSAEPTTIRLHVRRFNKNGKDRVGHYSNGYQSAQSGKEAQRNRHYNTANELVDSSSTSMTRPPSKTGILLISTIITALVCCFSYNRQILLNTQLHHQSQLYHHKLSH